MRPRLQIPLFIAGGIVLFLFTSVFFFSDHISEARERHAWHVPAPLNASLGFGKILMISLPSRTDRRDAMSLAFRVSGIESAEYIPSVRGEEIAAQALPREAENLDLGALGCWRGHANAWKRVIDEGWETALIIEGTNNFDQE